MKIYLKYIMLACLVLVLFQACNVKKFVPEGELLYTGATISLKSDTTIKKRSQLKTELESVLSPEPNSSFLGMQPGLYFHYKAQREKPGFINKFLNKKIGEKPVYASDVDPVRTEDLLKNRLQNRGFFYSNVISTVNRKEEMKKMSVAYAVDVPTPYLLEKYKLDSDSLQIYKEISKSIENSPLEEGMRFDLSTMKLERERIDRDLKAKGYYNFKFHNNCLVKF